MNKQFRVTQKVLFAVACILALAVALAREVSVRAERLAAHRSVLVDYARPEDATLEGRIAQSSFVGEVEIVGVDRRYMANGYDEVTKSMLVEPNSLGRFYEPVPGDVSRGDISPITEFQARVVETHAGDLKPGHVFVVRTHGHAAMTPAEVASNLARGLVMEQVGDRLLVTVDLAGDGRYVYVDGARIKVRAHDDGLEYLVGPGGRRDVIDNLGGLVNRTGFKVLARIYFAKPV
jgi:hypothetical protein